MPQIAGKPVSTNDAAVLGAGGLFLIFSFFPFYGFSGKLGEAFGIKSSVTAWHYGIMVLALILMAVAVVLVAVRLFSSLPDMPVGPRLATLAAAGIAGVITVIRVLTLDRQSAGGVSVGPKLGAWAMLVLGIVAVAFAFMAFRESGETMPTAGGGTTTPPPPPASD